MIGLERVFPYTLGANIGTTVTAIMAALATGNPSALGVALSHLMFNVSGIALFWWIQKRDALKLEHASLQRILNASSPSNTFLGRGKNEIKLVPTYSISNLRKKIDHIAKEIRKIDAKIQAMNWQIEI